MKTLTIAFLLLLASHLGYSQHWKYYRGEVSVAIGTSHFLGELGGANTLGSKGITGFKDLEFKLTRPSVAVGYRYFLTPMFAIKGDLTYARLNGDDALTTETFRNNRNLHFRSPAIEFSGRFEFYPMREYFGHLYRSKGIIGKKVRRISPYMFIGIGGFWFNPKAKYNGKWVKLAPLETEGVKYKKIAVSMPFGAGFKYALSRQMSIGLEMGLRYTTTDYIDDVSTTYIDKSNASEMEQYLANPALNNISDSDDSYATNPGQQRGGATENDSFLLTMLTFNYKFLKGRNNLPKF